MGKFYIALQSYSPNTAETNRYLGLLKTLSESKIETEVVFFSSDNNNSVALEMPHIHYHYLWKKFNPKNNRLKQLLSHFYFSRKFIAMLKEGDCVYLYGCNELIPKLVNKKGIKVYQERTEHPFVSKMRFLNMEKYLYACTLLDGLFVITTALKDYFISIGTPANKVHVINMTVDPTRFDGLKKEKTERYIAYCGKATNNKDGVDQLIKAFANTSKTHPDVKLYIIGTPPKRADQSGNLELVERLGISDKVVFTGIIPSEQIPQVLLNAEVLALARPDNMQAKYGFPTKHGEYLLTGNPVAITSVGDIPLFLKNGESALISNPDSVDDFALNLSWALDNPDNAKKIGETGKKIALANFIAENEYNKLIKVIGL